MKTRDSNIPNNNFLPSKSCSTPNRTVSVIINSYSSSRVILSGHPHKMQCSIPASVCGISMGLKVDDGVNVWPRSVYTFFCFRCQVPYSDCTIVVTRQKISTSAAKTIWLHLKLCNHHSFVKCLMLKLLCWCTSNQEWKTVNSFSNYSLTQPLFVGR